MLEIPYRTPAILLAFGVLLSGCGQKEAATVRIRNPWLESMQVAVAPALNFSGSTDFDPESVADIMASELSHVDGFSVMPVSRVLAVLARQGLSRIESPEHALEVQKLLGADAILVFSITEYDPYEPPVVGIAAQLYGSYKGAGMADFDPVLASRSATAPAVQDLEATIEPLAQAVGVFNAAHEPTITRVKIFAKHRNADDSAFGWQKYTASQQHYLRFCCHATIRELVENGVNRRKAENSL